MQDFKHLSSSKKNHFGLNFSKTGSSNRRLISSSEGVASKIRLPTGKRREQLKHLLLFLAIVLGLTLFVCLSSIKRLRQ